MRVLVCDDDPAARFVAKRWLTSALGCAVTDCADGVQALELLSAQPFDMALVDLELPRLSGIEVVEAIRANETTHDLPVVILSQERREHVVRALLALGVSAYLLKPLRERTVLGRLGPLLALHRATRGVSAGALLGPESPALLVDGDEAFRTSFAAVAGQYGPIVAAESGADALALYRRSPVDLVFIGSGLGIVGPETLVRKIREVESAARRIVGLGVSADSQASGLFDATMPRVVAAEELTGALRPYFRVAGPLMALEDLVPDVSTSLTAAVSQAFEAIGRIQAKPTAAGPLPAGPVVIAAVSVDIQAAFLLDFELAVPRAVAETVAARMTGTDRSQVSEEASLSAVSELATTVSRRLDETLLGSNLSGQCQPPVPRAVAGDDRHLGITPGDGFTCRFALAELDQPVLLRVRVRQTVTA
jgi:CheY-like chemotaxis protein